MCSTYSNCISWYRLLKAFCYVMLSISILSISYTFSYFFFHFISHCCSLPLPLMPPPLVFLFPLPLTAPTVSICNEASTLLPLLLAFSSLSHNLLAAHSRHLTPLFIDLGMGGGRGDAVYGVWKEDGQYFHKGYLRPLPLSSSSTIPERHTAGS